MLVGLCATAQERPTYGDSIDIKSAKKVVAAALQEATKNNWRVAIAVVDTHGLLRYYEMMDDTQTASGEIAVQKARTAAMFRRSTKVLQDAVNQGRPSMLGLPEVTPNEGGLPIVVEGRIVGAIGVSGVNSDQDGLIAQAGLAAVK